MVLFVFNALPLTKRPSRGQSHRSIASPVKCSIGRKKELYIPTPAHHTVSPLFTVTEAEFWEDPTIVSDVPLVRVVLLTDYDLPQILTVETRDDRHHSVGLRMKQVSLSKHDTDDHYSFPAAPVYHTVTFHRTTPKVSPNIRPRKASPYQPAPVPDDTILLYSSMVWTCPKMFTSLMAPNLDTPPWIAVRQHKVHFYRSVLAVHYGTCPEVAKALGYPPSTLLWGRDMALFKDQKPFLVCHQILSPVLERFIGSMEPPVPHPSNPPFPKLILPKTSPDRCSCSSF